jgi:cholesterol transport system auxiliary component
MNTTDFIALSAYFIRAKALFGIKNGLSKACLSAGAALLLTACATPQPPASKAVYDFGPVLSAAPAAAPASRLPTLALPEFEAGAGLDSPALLYRLQYADSQQLRPYALARWSVPPAQLVRARLRDALAGQMPVISLEGSTAWALHVELDEFSQLFASPESSLGLVRLRLSLMHQDKLVQQTSIVAQAPAPSPDAAGGVKALTAATDDAVRQISAWLARQSASPAPR